MVSVFSGQLMGTAVGNSIYADHGWYASGSAAVGFVAFALLVALVRGPHEKGWIGWHGGANMRKQVPRNTRKESKDVENVVVEDKPGSEVTIAVDSGAGNIDHTENEVQHGSPSPINQTEKIEQLRK